MLQVTGSVGPFPFLLGLNPERIRQLPPDPGDSCLEIFNSIPSLTPGESALETPVQPRLSM